MTKYNAVSDKAKPVSTFMTAFAGGINVQVVITSVDCGLKYNQLHLHRNATKIRYTVFRNFFFSIVFYIYKYVFIFDMNRT